MNNLKKYGSRVLFSSRRSILKFLGPMFRELLRIPVAKLDLKARAEGKSGVELNLYFFYMYLLLLLCYSVSFQIANCLDAFLDVTNSGQLIFGLILFSISCVIISLLFFMQLYALKPGDGIGVASVDYDQSESGYRKAKVLIYLFLACIVFGFVLVNCVVVIFSFTTLGHLWWIVPSAYSVIVMVTVSHLKGNIASLVAASKELPESARKKKLLRMAEKVGFPNVVLYQLPNSRISRGSPVSLSNRGRSPKIFFAPQVLELCSDDELMTVVAHELGHLIHQHRLTLDWIETILEIFSWCLVALLFCVIPHSSTSFYLILPLTFGLMGLFRSINEFTTKFIGRAFETQSDLYALNLTKDSASFKNAITKIEQIANENVEKCESILLKILASHPPVSKRIELAARWEKENLNS